MKKNIFVWILLLSFFQLVQAQLSPAITAWLQNTSQDGSYYTKGNSTAITNNILANCQKVEYSTDFVYISTKGVPSYPTGPFMDRNPSNAEDQDAIFKFPLSPSENKGTPITTTGGNIGVFINGVALFDYRDGVSWNPATNALCGGPGNTPCPGGRGAIMDWNRDAIPAEMEGFDCSKGHPAMGNYHHHQNPSAFKLDKNVVSTICNLYDADGLYTIDSTKHSPLIGFAYDGFPIYGAYGYKAINGSGVITRMKSGYSLRNITKRTEYGDGTDVDDGPDISSTYFLGYFREDYSFNANAATDYLDEHNGRFCKTPEYPNGTYAYFCTVDENWNSAYPYAVGPTFYGVSERRTVNSVTETTQVYTSTNGTSKINVNDLGIAVHPNPSSDLIAVQVAGLNKETLQVELYDITGKLIQTSTINPGQTIGYFDVQTLYAGTYMVKISNNYTSNTQKVLIKR